MSTSQIRKSTRVQDNTRVHNERLLAELKPGDIVKFFRGMYYHFALYIGNETVIHICELQDMETSEEIRTSFLASVSSSPKNKVRIAEESFWKAAKNCKGYKANNERYEAESYEFEEILRRAKSCLGTTDYHFLLKNCEHWVNKIKYDREESKQTSDLKIGFGVSSAILGLLGVGIAAYAVVKSRKNKETRSSTEPA